MKSNFNEVKSDIIAVNKRFDNTDEKFNELKIDINAVNIKYESKFDELNTKSVSYTHLDVYKRQVLKLWYILTI